MSGLYYGLSFAGLFWFALSLRFAIRERSLHRRPILFGFAILGVLPAIYVALVQAGFIADNWLRFERPLLTLIGAVVLPWMALRLAGFSPRQSPTRRTLTEGFIMLSTFGAALALPGPELGKSLDRLTVLVAIDRSRSIDLVPDAHARIASELALIEQSMREGDRLGTIAFAAGAALEDPPRPKADLPAPQTVQLGRDATDLASAIQRALEIAPSDSATRIVLISDGVANRGDTLAAAASAVAAEVPIDTLPLDQRVLPDIRVVALRAPHRAHEAEPIELRVVTSSPERARVEVRLKRDGELLQRGEVTIAAGEDLIRLREIAPPSGLHRYEVEITALDPDLDFSAENNAASTFLRVRGRGSALVVDGDGQVHFVAKALEEAAFRVDSGGPAALPTTLSELARHDLIVLSDLRAATLSEEQIEALASYARDLGGGLILLGGDRSMGPGGYGKTAIEEVSPVLFDVKNERKRASLAQIIVIDDSGSMGMSVGGGLTKLDLANEGAARSASLLGPGDRIGVAHVDTAVKWTVPLANVSDADAIGALIRATRVGGGGIYMDIALEAAYAALEKEKVGLKHLLVFADGDDAERIEGCRAQVTRAELRGITTSVVALGRGRDLAELEVLSRLGKGRFYLVEDATRLPAVFAEETVLAARSAINEVDFRPGVASLGPPIRGIDFQGAPPLHGYVVTTPKSRASVLLQGPEGDPILATWPVGLGRVGAFTSDLKDRWGSSWMNFAGASRMVGQLGRDVARGLDDPRIVLSADASGGELSVRADVVGGDGRAQSFRRLSATVTMPGGGAEELSLEPMGGGAHAGKLQLSRPGAHLVSVRDEASGELVGTTGAVLSAGEEMQPTGTDRATLSRIASMTGGKVRDNLAGVFHDRPKPRFSHLPLSPFFTVLAALSLLLSVASRRLSFPQRSRPRPLSPAPTPTLAHAPTPTPSHAPPPTPSHAPPHTHAPSPTHAHAPAPPPAPAPPLAHTPSPAPAPAPSPSPTPPRPLTAAEILLARRRNRRPE